MKYLVIAIGILVGIQSRAGVDLKALPKYLIVSDTKTNDTPPGMVRVKGMGYNEMGQVLKHASVGTIDEKHIAFTDSTGNFEFYIPEGNTDFYYYSFGYTEILVDDYEFKAGHTVTITFYLKKEQPITPDKPQEIISYKPVIYLYSDQPLTASLSLDYRGELTFTYPAYENGWKVDVGPDGIFDHTSSKTYPYLFWEGEMDDLNFQSNSSIPLGSIVKTDSIINFLDTQLSALGLNDVEKADFITFWGPRISQSNYAFVQFLVDEEYDISVGELHISPKPDVIRRVYILYTGFDQEPVIEQAIPQKFKKIERKGFTVVEWGGSQIKLENG